MPTVTEHTGSEDPVSYARRVARAPDLPAWAIEVRDRLLAGDEATLLVLERLADIAPWLFAQGASWLETPE